jgi:GT2 family glycosyltransferase
LPNLSIIVVNYRGWERLSQCLDSLNVIEDSRFTHEVIVVDNNSGDGQIARFRVQYPKFKFILNTGNLGFANGCNLGAVYSRGSNYLFLNPDTIVTADALFGMLSEIRARGPYSIVSCCQIRENGANERPYGRYISPSTLTGWLRALLKIGFIHGKEPFLQTDDYLYPDWISGSVALIKRESFLGLGGWDDDFWMYFEDVDLCFRARQKKGEIVLLKNICVEHNHGGATRINQHVTALTKAEVDISRHVYISKHERGLKASYMHLFLIFNNLFLGFFPAIAGLFFFFIKDLNVISHTYFRLVSYYFNVMHTGTWLSMRSVKTLLNNKIRDYKIGIQRD